MDPEGLIRDEKINRAVGADETMPDDPEDETDPDVTALEEE